MLTPKENLLETIRGGKPDRLVKQMEALYTPYSDPYNATNNVPYFPGDEDKKDYWGVTWSYPENTPGMFPVHHSGLKVIPDIEEWDGKLITPPLEYPDELWEAAQKDYEEIDRTQYFVGPMMFPGLFEQTHCLMGMDDALMNFYEEPEKMHDLIEAITEWEIGYARQLTANLHPDMVFRHDDWGSSLSTFMSVDMFREFYLAPYKRLYGFYKDHGVELIVHHSDSYAATFVPMMIEMGIDIWQGGTDKNDIPALIRQYGGQISFMTGIENGKVDKPDWSPENIQTIVSEVCTSCGPRYFIPCQTMGAPVSTFEGVYEAIDKAIEAESKKYYKSGN